MSETRLPIRQIDASFFNVLDYGAKGDGTTDDTAAIQAALNACVAFGGGTVWFPYTQNTYIAAGALQTSVSSVNPNCQLYIPNVPMATKMVTVTLKGSARPAFFSEGFGTIFRNTQGVTIESTITGSGTFPSVIGSSYQNYTGIGNRNYVHVHFENIIIRTSTMSGSTDIAGTMCGINGQYLNSMSFKDIKVDISSKLTSAVNPTNETYGIILPAVNNKAELYQDGIGWFEGYKYGLVAQEHFKASYLVIAGCVNGLVCDRAFHGISVHTLLVENCVNNIRMVGEANLYIASMHTEHHADGKWWDFANDVYFVTPASTIVSTLTYLRTRSVHIAHFNQVTPNVGVENKFVTNATGTDNVYVDKMGNVDLNKTVQSLTYAAGLSLNLFLGKKATLTLTGNCAVTLSNVMNNDFIELVVKQDATGSRTLSINGLFVAITATASAITTVRGTYDGTSWYFGTVSASAVAGVSAFPNAGLTGYWALSDLTDSGPNGFALTNNNAVTFGAGKVGNGALFASASAQYLSATNSNVLSAGAGLTVAGWFKVTTGSTGTLNFASKMLLAGNQKEYSLYWSSSFAHFTISSDGAAYTVDVSGSSNWAADGVWRHLVGTWDGTVARIYLNNVLTATSASITTVKSNGTANFEIGSNPYATTTLNGGADEVGVWNRALSAAEIAYLYNSGAGTTKS